MRGAMREVVDMLRRLFLFRQLVTGVFVDFLLLLIVIQMGCGVAKVCGRLP